MRQPIPFDSSANRLFTRRQLLEMSGLGFGSLALTVLLNEQGIFASDEKAMGQLNSDLKPRSAHFKPKAKAVIQLMQNGGPSQMDLFDPKPELKKRAGQPHPEKVETIMAENKNVLMPSPFEFKRHGQSGMEFSQVIPNMGSIADELCLVRSMYTEHNNHAEGLNMMQTCKIFPGRPAMGSWISYALGTENQNLPGFIAMCPGGYPIKAPRTGVAPFCRVRSRAPISIAGIRRSTS